MKPYLSICIPTYNRSLLLKETIESIICQPEFQNTNDVEIVISDNASMDDTPRICKYYLDLFPSKFTYHRNEINILDSNFERVLSLGNGDYLKLNNDTLKHNYGSLSVLLNNIKSTDFSNTLLIFNASEQKKDISIKNLDDFVDYLSYFITWISLLGLSKVQFNRIRPLFSEYSKTQLAQVAVILELASSNKVTVVNCNEYFISVAPKEKGGYDLIDVFLNNYLRILNIYLGKKKLAYYTIKNQKEKIIFNLILPYYFKQLSNSNIYNFRFKYRIYRIVYYLIPNIKLIIKYLLMELKSIVYRFKKRVKKNINYFLCEKSNKNASIQNKSVFTKDNLKNENYHIGDFTYGFPLVHDWADGAILKIGKYTSIATNVTILLGGEHNYKAISTYPFNSIEHQSKQPSVDRRTKGDVIIGNDVWIGCNVTILSGVKIGNGAVIGAGSIVVKDVPPYGIYFGNSGCTKKFRFEQEVVTKLLEISWWDWPVEKIEKEKDRLMTENVSYFIDDFVA